MKKIALICMIVVGLLAISVSASAKSPSGNWCTTKSGGTIGFKIEQKKGNGYRISFYKSGSSSAYSWGYGKMVNGVIYFATYNPEENLSVFVEAIISGKKLHYESFNLDGVSRFEAKYYRCY